MAGSCRLLAQDLPGDLRKAEAGRIAGLENSAFSELRPATNSLEFHVRA